MFLFFAATLGSHGIKFRIFIFSQDHHRERSNRFLLTFDITRLFPIEYILSFSLVKANQVEVTGHLDIS